MAYLERFLYEYESARVNLTLTKHGYERYIVDLYPNKLSIIDIFLHLTWFGIALFFAFRISEMGWMGTFATSFGGMLLALIVGKFLPIGILLGGAAFFLGIVALPYQVLAGPIGLLGLNSISKQLGKWYGMNLVRRWCIGSEDQFLRAVGEGTIIVTANRRATQETKVFLKQLSEAIGEGDPVG